MADPKITEVRTGGNGWGLAMIAIALLVIAAVGYMFYTSEQRKDSAVTGAAEAVGDAAQQVGDAAKDAPKPAN